MKITKRNLQNLLREQSGFTGDPNSTATKLLDAMVDGLEKKLLSMRLDEEEVDEMLIELMQVSGSDIEALLVKLLEGGYRNDYEDY